MIRITGPAHNFLELELSGELVDGTPVMENLDASGESNSRLNSQAMKRMRCLDLETPYLKSRV